MKHRVINCNWSCIQIATNHQHGYWRSDATFNATGHNVTCLGVFSKWDKWGSYNLRCSAADTQLACLQLRALWAAPGTTSTAPGVTISTPRTTHSSHQYGHNLRKRHQLTTEELLNAVFPNSSYPHRIHYEATIQCNAIQ